MITHIELDISDVVKAIRKYVKEKHPDIEVHDIKVKTWNYVVFQTEHDEQGNRDKLLEWDHWIDPLRMKL